MRTADPPGLDVLDFLGRYEDAADGFDPLALGEPAEGEPSGAKVDRQRDGEP